VGAGKRPNQDNVGAVSNTAERLSTISLKWSMLKRVEAPDDRPDHRSLRAIAQRPFGLIAHGL
jgi:hypothetical protein